MNHLINALANIFGGIVIGASALLLSPEYRSNYVFYKICTIVWALIALIAYNYISYKQICEDPEKAQKDRYQ